MKPLLVANTKVCGHGLDFCAPIPGRKRDYRIAAGAEMEPMKTLLLPKAPLHAKAGEQWAAIFTAEPKPGFISTWRGGADILDFLGTGPESDLLMAD